PQVRCFTNMAAGRRNATPLAGDRHLAHHRPPRIAIGRRFDPIRSDPIRSDPIRSDLEHMSAPPIRKGEGPLPPEVHETEGLNPDDPGIRLLGQAAQGLPASDILLVHCGDVPTIPDGATRIVLDVRELAHTRHTIWTPARSIAR